MKPIKELTDDELVAEIKKSAKRLSTSDFESVTAIAKQLGIEEDFEEMLGGYKPPNASS